MEPKISIITTGLKILSFQGITVSNGDIVVSTLDGDLLRISSKVAKEESLWSIAKWANVYNFGIPTGVADIHGTIVVAVSALESGDFLMRVTQSGDVSSIADLSTVTGEFGAPFGVAVHLSYYCMVAISTDVIASRGLVIRVNPQGKISEVAKLSSSPLGIAANQDGFAVTQEDGQLLQISVSGKIKAIANLDSAGLGKPLGVIYDQDNCIVATNAGFLVKVFPDGRLEKLINLVEAGFGYPTNITTIGNSYIVATSWGDLLQVTNTGWVNTVR